MSAQRVRLLAPEMSSILALTLTSVDFWGPLSNFGIPIAAIMDTQKDPEMLVCTLSLLGKCSQAARELSLMLLL